jgi:Ca-activated chloride channel family protein
VAFAGQAFLQCPLTLDYDAFFESLAGINVETIPVPGTDLARALDEAALAMTKTEGRKVLILLTDGEDLEKSGVRVAETLGKKGVSVYTVGVGTEAGAMIQIPNDTGAMDYLRDRKGEPVRSRLDESVLQAIANATGGEYSRLSGIGEGMARVQKSVLSTEGQKRAVQARTRGIDRFQWPLAVAIFLLVVESLLTTRRRVRAEINRESMTSRTTIPAVAALMLTVLWPVNAWSATDRTASLKTPRDFYNEGVRLLNEGNFRDAEGWLLKAAGSNNERIQPPALYDLGHVRFQQGKELLKGQQERQPMMESAARSEQGGQDSSRLSAHICKDGLLANRCVYRRRIFSALLISTVPY